MKIKLKLELYQSRNALHLKPCLTIIFTIWRWNFRW